MTVRAPLEAPRMTPYLWGLLAMLVSATIFDGFDVAILSAVAPIVQREYALTNADWGLANTVVRLGGAASFFLVLLADRWGRRPLITLTVLGYALFTGLTAASWSVASFTAFQLGARLFLAAEFGVALIVISEEFPTRWRSIGISLMVAVIAVGTIAAFLAAGPIIQRYTWKAMYLLGLAPLVLVFLFRLGMRETRRFTHATSVRGRKTWRDLVAGIWLPFDRRWRRRTLLVTLLWNCSYLVTSPAITFWTIHASKNLGYGPKQYGLVVSAAYVCGFLATPLAGFLMNRVGRRLSCAGFYFAASGAIFLLFRVDAPALGVQITLMSATVVLFLGANAVTYTYAAELFPTEIRATGYGWTTNLFGRMTEIGTPLVIGLLADRIGIPAAVGVVAIGPVIGALAVLKWAPETRAMTLEQIDAAG